MSINGNDSNKTYNGDSSRCEATCEDRSPGRRLEYTAPIHQTNDHTGIDINKTTSFQPQIQMNQNGFNVPQQNHMAGYNYSHIGNANNLYMETPQNSYIQQSQGPPINYNMYRYQPHYGYGQHGPNNYIQYNQQYQPQCQPVPNVPLSDHQSVLQSMSDPGMNYSNNNINLSVREISDLIPDFDPSSRECECVSYWLNCIEELRDVYQLNEKLILFAAAKKLKGEAKSWYFSEMRNKSIRNWYQLREGLAREFGSIRDPVDIHAILSDRRRRQSESFTEYVYEMRKIASEINLDELCMIKYIIRGIADTDLTKSLASQDIFSVNELLDRIRKYQNIMLNQNNDKYLNRNTQCNYNNRSNNSHRFQNRYSLGQNRLPDNTRNTARRLICSFCKQEGHYEVNCPSKKQSVRRVEYLENEYIKMVKINDSFVKTFIDLGSDCVTIKESMANELHLKSLPNHINRSLRGFGNSQISTLGEIFVDLEIDEVQIRNAKVFIIPDFAQREPLMIGRSVLDRENILVLKANNFLRILQVPEQGKEMQISDGKGQTKFQISVDCENDPPVNKNDSYIELISDEYFDSQLNSDTNNDQKETLREEISKISSQLVIKDRNSVTNKDMEIQYSEISDDVFSSCIDKNIDGLTKTDIKLLIEKYRDCFALNLKELGKTGKAEITIKLTDTEPVCYRPYRLSHVQLEEVRLQIKEYLDLGIIKPSNSEYSSPIVVVKKKNGESRICVDYRRLNSKTIKDRFPIPNMEDSIQRLSGKKFFTVLDLASGYYQVPVSKSSKKFTSFVTPDNQYEFERMPFGLVNAPAVFQRLMNKLAQELNNEIIVYLDDIILPSLTIVDGLDLFEKVLKKLREYGLTIKLSKCRIMVKEVEYLGHEVSFNSIRPGIRKIAAVQKFPTPKNIHHIRQFIGLASFFRKFVPNFAVLAEPLTRLTRADNKFEWLAIQEKSFQTIKEILCRRNVLVMFDHRKEHEIHTDASSLGIAGMLLQKEEDDKWHAISYFSRQTSDLERKFHSYELEALAVVETLERFRTYVLGKLVTVVTDCKALNTTSSKRDIIPRIGRWWLRLQEFQFEIKHRCGKQMSHIDALSRNAVEEPTQIEPAMIDIFRIDDIDEDWLFVLQQNDSDINNITENINDTKYTDYSVENGRLYKKLNGKLLFVIPKGVRGRICRNYHDDSGHFSLDRTLAKIRELFWWPRMRQFVKKYIASCIECLYHKTNVDSHRIELHPIEKIPIPFHTWHLDHLGPFIKSTKNNCHILVIVDAFTKYVHMRPVRDTSSRLVVNALNEMSLYFGMPVRVVTDRGTAFTAKCFADFCKQHNIIHVLNATSTPRANGQVERYNRTVLHAMRTMADKEPTKWDQLLAKIQWAINNQKHAVTKLSPHEVLFGFTLKPKYADKITLELYNENTNKQQLEPEIKETYREQALKLIRENQYQQKLRSDAKFKKPRSYNVGDMVVVYREPPSAGESRKLLRRFRGPYVVTEILYGDRYRVEDVIADDGRRRFRGVIPSDHLRLVIAPEDQEFVDSDVSEVEDNLH